jgi:hypothetical protein
MSRTISDIRLLTDAQLDSVAGGYPPEPINGFRLWPPSRSPPVPSRTHNPAVPPRASKPLSVSLSVETPVAHRASARRGNALPPCLKAFHK